MLSVRDLTKWYGATLALDRVSFEVGAGEIVGFLGPNGAGKTTAMRIVTGFIPASAGTALVDGRDVFKESLVTRANIGYLPENVPLYLDLRVEEYLHFRAKLKGVARRTRRLQVASAMDRCFISDVSRKLIGQLSKGYRQRVGLADTLLGSPKLLILDEPTVGLDPNQVRQVRRLVKELGRDHTILLSTHILPEVEMTCDRVIIIHRGRIVAEDRMHELKERMRDSQTIYVEIRGEGRLPQDAMTAVTGVTGVQSEKTADGVYVLHVRAQPETDIREALARAFFERGFVVREMRTVAPSLEEVFVRVTAGEADAAAGRGAGAESGRHAAVGTGAGPGTGPGPGPGAGPGRDQVESG